MSVHKCPVCEGRGQVPAGFYHIYHSGTAVNTSPETCKSCSGKGVIFDTDCFYPNINTPLLDDYNFRYGSIVAINTCSNCGHNDGMVYTSNPVKYKCTLTDKWFYSDHCCESWCPQQLKLLTGTEGTLNGYTMLNADNSEGTVEFINGTNTTEQTAEQ